MGVPQRMRRTTAQPRSTKFTSSSKKLNSRTMTSRVWHDNFIARSKKVVQRDIHPGCRPGSLFRNKFREHPLYQDVVEATKDNTFAWTREAFICQKYLIEQHGAEVFHPENPAGLSHGRQDQIGRTYLASHTAQTAEELLSWL